METQHYLNAMRGQKKKKHALFRLLVISTLRSTETLAQIRQQTWHNYISLSEIKSHSMY